MPKWTGWLYFYQEKKNGTFETILNLKYLDGFVEYKHFKMESLEYAFKIIKEDGWMANVDLKDAFFTILVHILYQKYFKFESFNQFYKFLGMQNGHSNAIRVFTENFKTSLWILSDCNWTRTQNHLVCKRTLNHLAKLATWLSSVLNTYLYGAFDCMFLPCHIRILEWIHSL